MNSTVTANPIDTITQRCVFYLIAAFTALIPLESFLITLAWRTGLFPGRVLFAMQFAIEGLVYAALLAVLAVRLIKDRCLRRTPIDTPLLVIFAIVVVSIALNNAPLVGSLMNLRSAFRYVAVFYLVTQLGLSRRQVSTVLWIILISGLLQLIAGLAQWVVGYNLKVWMLPYTSQIEIAGKARRFAIVERGREIGSIFGTLGDTLYYGLFMLVVLTVYLARIRRLRIWDGLSLLLVYLMVAYSYSRAAVIAGGLTLMSFAGGLLGLRRVAGGFLLAISLGLVLIAGSMLMETQGGVYHHPRQGRRSIVRNMTNIFSVEYLERAKRQRLGAVIGVAPTALMNAPLFGYGPDQGYAIERLNEAYRTRLYKTMTKEGFEDVYWVALLCYTGVVGALAVMWLGVRMMWTCAAVVRGARGDPVLRWAGLAGFCIVAQAALLMWFNRVPEIRSFSFYLWLLPALAYAAWSAPPESPSAEVDDTTQS